MIPQSFLDSLLQRVDIVEVVGAHVQLKKAGANLSGLCPFHTEKSPSFTVSPTKQFYHCFGCGAHGTAVGFLIEHLGLSFPQAVEELAHRVGMEVPKAENTAVDHQNRAHRQSLQDRCLAAAKFYQRRLKDSPPAIEYLKGRGLTGEIAARYHLGFAPEGWQSLQAVFADYESEDLVEAGLVISSDDEGRSKRYDRFRNRLMFPILSPRGEVIGFGARTLGADEPKYLNSPETPVFQKGQTLYGLFEARAAIRASAQVWVVEGYMDVVALAQHGLSHVVATLGTATTADHIRMLLRHTSQIVFMFDGDAAGRRAAAKALEIALASVNERSLMRFVFLPPEHDPDSFVRAQGAKALEDYVAKGQPLSSFLQSRAVEGQDLATAEGRSLATSEAKRLLALMPHCQLKSQIALELADRLRTDTATLGLIAPRLSQSSRANGGNESNWANRSKTSTPAQRGLKKVAPLTEGRERRPVLTLGDRLWKALVQRPAMANQLTELAREALESADRTLLAWFIERSGEIGHFASLHEMLEQETVPPAFRDRLRQAMRSELEIENNPEADFATIQVGLERRALEQQAAELATRAQSDASAMDALR
ncbi:MAG: hypothetical protein RI968_826, partial [Pseudomonadota bacterium]